ncbi:hypothetical protein GCM10022222_74650 [Amycolatopsis ultiminotia]|uniref:Biotin synthase auxiliary protein n=1 Tax=Amycolatopsis ultiminotia TaxID=543629 RepID=A0ABP6Y851_9PSEU
MTASEPDQPDPGQPTRPARPEQSGLSSRPGQPEPQGQPGRSECPGESQPSGQSGYCVHCGRAAGGAGHTACHTPRTALEPPRFCRFCARRMVVQVTPLGWSARCSRHGETAGG